LTSHPPHPLPQPPPPWHAEAFGEGGPAAPVDITFMFQSLSRSAALRRWMIEKIIGSDRSM
jgi:hypothetical protein